MSICEFWPPTAVTVGFIHAWYVPIKVQSLRNKTLNDTRIISTHILSMQCSAFLIKEIFLIIILKCFYFWQSFSKVTQFLIYCSPCFPETTEDTAPGFKHIHSKRCNWWWEKYSDPYLSTSTKTAMKLYFVTAKNPPICKRVDFWGVVGRVVCHPRVSVCDKLGMKLMKQLSHKWYLQVKVHKNWVHTRSTCSVPLTDVLGYMASLITKN